MDDDAKTEATQDDPNVGEDTQEETEPQAPKKKPKIILFAAGGLVIIVLAVVGYLVFAQSSQASEEEDGTAIQEEQAEENPRSRREDSPRKSRRGSEEKNVEGTDIFFTDFPASVVNLGLSENYNYVYLKYGFNLELASEKVRAELTRKMPKIMSTVSTLLTGRKWDQICNQHGRHSLEMEMVDTINEELETGEVIACHFITFVAQ